MKDLPVIPQKTPPDPIRDTLKSLARQFIANPALDTNEQARTQLNTIVLHYLGCFSGAQGVILNAVREFTGLTALGHPE